MPNTHKMGTLSSAERLEICCRLPVYSDVPLVGCVLSFIGINHSFPPETAHAAAARTHPLCI